LAEERFVVKTRPFKLTDLDRCVKLFVQVFSEEPWQDQWPSLDRAREYLSDIVATPGFEGFIAYEGRKLLGLCLGHKVRWWAGDEFYIDEFCVDSNVQRSGVGTQLLDYARERLRKKRIQFVVLLTERDTLAERFYVKQGFDTSDKAIFMYHRLDGARARGSRASTTK
jgi:ribosomal protein S18 acetylase RimI-like enzyme